MDRLGFNYDYSPDLSDASKYNLFVTDPDGKAHRSWADAKETGTKFLAYLAWYEIGPGDPYPVTGKKLIKEATKRGIEVLADNPRWQSKIMDVSNPEWIKLFMELVADAEKKGYDGIYFDTWDGYGDIPRLKPKKKAKLLEANGKILRRIRKTFPALQLMVNRGWEVMKDAAAYSDRMLVESVWCSHDGPVSPSKTAELKRLISQAQGYGFEVNVLDYEPTGDTDTAEAICSNARSIGCGCTVLRGSLTSPEVLAVSP